VSFTRALAEHVASTPFDALPPTAIHAAKTFILDSLGVACAGAIGTFRNELVAQMQRAGRADEASVWISGERLPAAHAALVNAYQIHNQEFDCVHEGAVVHPMAVILAALLADAERGPIRSGRDLILAVTLAVDVAATLGLAARAPLKFFRPAQCGALGAIAALTRWHGGDADAIKNAWGVGLGQLSGTMQAHREGVPLLPMQIAFNARNAVVASDLARAGLSGPLDALEGEFGYLKLFHGEYALDGLSEALGRVWRITEVSHKPFPSGRATHGGVDALLTLSQGRPLTDSRALQLYAPPLIRQLVDRPAHAGMSLNYAKLCFPYVAARAALTGGVDIDDFSDAARRDPATLALAARISVHPDDNPDPNALTPQRLVVVAGDGTRAEHAIPTVLGAPTRPLCRAQHLNKFRRNAARVGIDPQLLIDQIDALETLSDVRALVALLGTA
jgi:aconitate decarboxylase